MMADFQEFVFEFYRSILLLGIALTLVASWFLAIVMMFKGLDQT